MIDIDTIRRHDRVRLPGGEIGRVSRIDHDDHVVWVDVAVESAFGDKVTDTIDLDPDEPGFELAE